MSQLETIAVVVGVEILVLAMLLVLGRKSRKRKSIYGRSSDGN